MPYADRDSLASIAAVADTERHVIADHRHTGQCVGPLAESLGPVPEFSFWIGRLPAAGERELAVA